MTDTPLRTDQQLAKAALEKRQRGEKPTREEDAALGRIKKTSEESARISHFSAVRKGEWSKWSGRQVKVLNEQAARYGIPIGGPTISIQEVALWLHNFLADNAVALAAAAGEDGPDARERLTSIKCELEQLKLERERGQWLPKREVREGLGNAARIIRTAGEALLRQYGPGAKKVLDDALDSVQSDVDCRFTDHEQPSA